MATIKTHAAEGIVEIEVPVLYESEGWIVIESREYVPAGHYEVRDPKGRRYGIWDSPEAAIQHLHDAQMEVSSDVYAADWIDKIANPD